MLQATHTRTSDPAIDGDAPVVSAAEVEIDAPIEHVWAVLTTIDQWPSWNPDVKSVSMAGPLAVGSTFRWKAGPGTISSIIEHVESPRLVAWSGRTLGIRAFHVWRLEARDGKTHAHTEESYDGLVARVLRRSLQKTLDSALADGARCPECGAEKAAPPPP
jgi:carbon monoxide dehydrogenase subunit G